ncbi:MAG: Mur ligase family protein [Dehalococcoidia bacterium]|nr:Mur ligase family protein [Dehalococcoidia bacterium]
MLTVPHGVVLRTARLLGAISRRSGRGGGTALPGLLVERVAPGLVSDLSASLPHGNILVTGTNGKTTTARLIAALLQHAGLRVVHNRAGSNLLRGIAAALVQGTAAGNDRGIGLFEVDEATLPAAVGLVRPRLMVLLNLFRDQLDRYGEVDTVAQHWRSALTALPAGSGVVLNADDPFVASLGRGFPGPVTYFGLDDPGAALREREAAADFVECPACRLPYDYTLTFYGHLGHYRCQNCGSGRPEPQVRATSAHNNGPAGTAITVQTPGNTVTVNLPLPGLYNAYNLLAALATGAALQLPEAGAAAAIESVRSAFGRGERFQFEGRPVVMLLIKNPVGANQVLRTIRDEPGDKNVMIALNDLTADGEDISWIWDVDFEQLAGTTGAVVTSGRRAADMALRLKYAGWFETHRRDDAGVTRPTVLPDLEQALRTALYQLPSGATLYLLPTYTAMLALRRILSRLGMVRPFWETEG